jgi:hypothetical protein
MTENQQKLVESIKLSLPDLAAPLRPTVERLGYPEDFLIAMCVTSALGILGIEAELLAGSAAWLVMDDELQGEALIEGKKVTPFFGYRFDATKALPIMVKFEYPEDLHSFVRVEGSVIYDFTLGLQRAAYKEASGMAWPAKTAPPDIIVGEPEDLVVRGWQYQEHDRASDYVRHLAQRVVFLTATGFGQ